MAIIRELFQDKRTCSRHMSEVECGWQVITDPAGDLLQLATFGSDTRKSHKKVSQTVQLDRDSARQLLGILQDFVGAR
jgi:hypothetical protein